MQTTDVPLHSDFMKRALEEIGASLKKERRFGPQNLSLEDIELLYSLGYGLYQSDDLTQAEIIFRRLVIADPLRHKHWWAFGAVLQAKQEYEQALTSWSMCCLFDETDPEPHFRAAECLFSLEQKEQAMLALDAARERCTEKNAELTKKITLLRDCHKIVQRANHV